MPFPFATFTTLLENLERVELRDPPLLPAPKAEALKAETERWFRSHRHTIDGLDVRGATALLSSMLPEQRTDRVYGIQAISLCRILCRSLGLRSDRTGDLQAYTQPDRGDLGACLQRVLKAGGPPARPPVTLEEVDDMLEAFAGRCRFSDRSITVSFPPGSSEARDKFLGDVFKRVTPVDGKWLVRLILKDYSPIRIHEFAVLRQFHFLLPDLLRFQSSFKSAISLLKEQPLLRQLPERPDPRSERLHRQMAASAIRPVIGVKVGRPTFLKARSIDGCMQLLGSQKWVVERKYDGEYCEIHIEQSKSTRPLECIQIFSKSGKDSTVDRKGLHQTLVDCLRLGRADCKIKTQAILLGELVVYSAKTRSVLGFDKIRKHVSRSGVFLGNEQDSQAHTHEHLAIVFFDLLLLDDEIVMTKSVEERRQWLREVYRKIPGRAVSAEWKIVDFAEPKRAQRVLMEQFAASNVQRCEGLILKPCGVPYFSLDLGSSEICRCYIKLKKDYIESMGDEADFAVVGASYNAQQALRSGIRGVKWTDFHLGCMMNAAEVQRFDAKPVFKIVGTIQQEACIPKPILQTLNTAGTHLAKPYDDTFDHFALQETNVKMNVLFSTPFVLEVLGSSFDKPPNSAFYMLRHPRATKLHQDRSWKECVSFQALQERAQAARATPVTAEGERDETRVWIKRLEGKLKRRLDREGILTPASRRSTPSTARAVSGKGLEGPTLVQQCSTGSKRPSSGDGETPCPRAKKLRPSSSDCPSAIVSSSKTCQAGQRPCNAPLSDITNQALGRDAPATRTVASMSKARSKHRRAIPSPTATSTACEGTRCPFDASTVLLAPCIAHAHSITQDLLPSHHASLTTDLAHWDRDGFAHPALTETVSESQACGGLRKVVLVEGKRRGAVEDVIEGVLALNEGRMRERVEVWDWRVLEECGGHDRSAEVLKRYFVGATVWNRAEERGMFVSRLPGLSHT
ncbi:hypothetical protein LTR35_002034 [Friedmanniomyces endolithicus]|nr:hypothetical protein LTS00_010342 [Friedmanniomyces endolithicus]KAK0291311.1 hypothetical protein LTR35_002034 [Friedmanniomyces endolithicus]